MLLKNANYFLIPMYTLTLDKSCDYLTEFDFFRSLKKNNKLYFHNIAVFRDSAFIGTYICDDIGSCGFSLYKDTPNTFGRFLKNIKVVEEKEPDLVFYVQGILHAWWVVKDYNIEVFSLTERKFFTPGDFLNTFYTNEKLKMMIEDISNINKKL